MFAATTIKTSLFKAFRVTKRDLQVFGVSAVLFTSIALGAVTMIQPAHSQTANAAADVCSAAKYFR